VKEITMLCHDLVFAAHTGRKNLPAIFPETMVAKNETIDKRLCNAM
jgi:hypothetical protein